MKSNGFIGGKVRVSPIPDPIPGPVPGGRAGVAGFRGAPAGLKTPTMLLAMLLAATALSGCMASSIGDSLDQAAFSGTPPTLEDSGTGATARFAVLGSQGDDTQILPRTTSTPDETDGSGTELASTLPVPSPSPRAAPASGDAETGTSQQDMSVALAETVRPVRSDAEAAADDIAGAETALAEGSTSEGDEGQIEPAASSADENATGDQQILTASLEAEQPARKPSFFERLAQKRAEAAASAKTGTQDARPLIDPGQPARSSTTSSASASALPGVQSGSALFGIGGDNAGDDSLPGEEDVQVASVGPLGRIISNGLILQTESVKVDCFKPELMQILRVVERHYGKRVIVTSGYRSPNRNKGAGGVQNSTHIYCKAADIQIDGVNKWDLAKFLRTVPGRGGVGTYCRTDSVHIDVGTQRDWHHPCRRGGSSARTKA